MKIKFGEFDAVVSKADEKRLADDLMHYGRMIIQYTEPKKKKSIKARRIDPAMVRIVDR